MTTINDLKHKDFSLVLSGGGALGMYYLGVFKFLEEKHIFPKEIIGTSIGAVLGSLWAQGFTSEEITYKITSILKSCGNSSQKFSKQFKKELLGMYLDTNKEFKIPFSALTLEYLTLEPKKFDFPSNHNLREVILAATALPGKYEPVTIEGVSYVDAYSITNFPVEFASSKYILGIDVLSSCELSQFRESKSLILSVKKNAFALYSRSLFKIIQKDSISKAKEYNCMYISPKGSTHDLFRYSTIDERIKQGYDDMKNLFKK